jgi:hypothetical protein
MKTVSRLAGICAIAGIAASPHAAFSKTVTADTVVSSLLCADSISYPLGQGSLGTKASHLQMGLITIYNAPVIIDTLPPGTLPPLPAGTYPALPFNLPLNVINTAVFDSNSPPLSITIRNLSSATISTLNLSIFDSLRSTSLGPYDSATLSFPVAGKGITGGVLGVQAGYSADDTARVAVEINYNGLVVSEITALYSVLQGFRKSFANDYGLSDSLDIKYLDIRDGYYSYSFVNYTQNTLLLQAEQLNLWDKAVCVARGVDSAEAIGGAFAYADSCVGAYSCMGYYFGNLTSGYLGVNTNDSLRINTSALAQIRLFPLWNDSTHQSVSRVLYTIRIANPSNPATMLTLKSTDSICIAVSPSNIHYQEMLATVKQEYVREGDTAKVKVPSPWNAASSDSLGKDVWADISMITRLPDSTLFQPRRATIDTLGVTYTFFDPANTAASVQCSAEFLNVRDSMLLNQQTNLTSLMSLWPDSIYIAVKTTIPVGTRVLLVNEQTMVDPDYMLYMGLMNINGDYTVNIYELTGVIARDMKKTFNGFNVQYVNDKLIISFPETFAGPAEVSLFSLSGRCIKKVSLSGRGKIAVPVGSETARGTYSVTVSSRSGICTRKIVVR